MRLGCGMRLSRIGTSAPARFKGATANVLRREVKRYIETV